MKKKQLLLSAMLVLMGTGMVNAQKAYTHVNQDGEKIESLGTAAFDLSQEPMVVFEGGKAVMKIGGNKVAILPMRNEGELVVSLSTTVAEAELNKVNKTVTSAGYATLYSPFQLQVPEEPAVETYAPIYDKGRHVLKCSDAAQVGAGGIIPAGTGLLLKNVGDITYAISGDAATAAHSSALTGSALSVDKTDAGAGSDQTLYTLGRAKSDATRVGFYRYTGTKKLPAGSAWLIAQTVSTSEARNFVSFDFDEDGIVELSDESLVSEAPVASRRNVFLENGRIVILKDGKKYNVNGQEVK